MSSTNELQQRPKFDTFLKTLFCILESSPNLSAVPISTGQYFLETFFFNLLKTNHFWNFEILS